MLQEQSFILVLSNAIILALLFIIYNKAKCPPYRISKSGHIVGLLLIALFMLFSFWGNDWFHMYNSYDYVKSGDRTHMEEIYVWLIQNVCSNYFIFRIVVWGTAFYLFNETIRGFNISKHLCYLMFIIFGLLWFSYSRVSLTMAMLFCGLAKLFKPKRNIIVGLLLICGSYFFHKSSLFGIAVVAIGLIWQIFKGRAKLIILFLSLLLFYYLEPFVDSIMALEVEDMEDSLSKSLRSAQSYLERDEVARSITSYVLNYLERIIYFIIAIISLIIHGKKYSTIVPPKILVFAKALMITVLVSTIMTISVDLNLQWVSERFYRFSFIPATVIMAFLWENKIFPHWTKFVAVLGLLCTWGSVLYVLYIL